MPAKSRARRSCSTTPSSRCGPGRRAPYAASSRPGGLAADGVVGPQTWEALVVTVQYGGSGDAVRACQSQLKAHGSYITVDGAFGPATQAALTSFQQSVGLAGDGVCGPTTWSKLVAERAMIGR